MANVLTNLAADIYKAADVVGRELVGFIPASTINANGSERVAKGDTVRASFTRAATAVDVSESMTIPEGTDQTVDSKTLSISKARAVQIPYTGEDILHLNNGIGFETVYGDQIVQAMRTITNEIELDLATEAATEAAAGSIGTAGTTPFASGFGEVADLRKLLVDNGMPTNDGLASLIVDTAAGANLRQLAQLQRANEAGGTDLLRQGILLDLQGVAIRESANVDVDGSSNPINIVMHRNAMELAVRAPAVPNGGDSADDALLVQDPHSGMVFEVRMYKGYRKSMIEVAAAWGVKAWKPEFIGKLLG
jgi:hypothetical protein